MYFSETGREQHTLEHLSHSLEELIDMRPLEDVHLQTHTHMLYLSTPTHRKAEVTGTFISEYMIMLECEHVPRKSCDPSEGLLLARDYVTV